jgi:hypothetical protein
LVAFISGKNGLKERFTLNTPLTYRVPSNQKLEY